MVGLLFARELAALSMELGSRNRGRRHLERQSLLPIGAHIESNAAGSWARPDRMPKSIACD